MRPVSLNECDISEKLLYSAFLILMGIGYLMALTYLYTTHEWHDGKAGLSVEDVAETYYGNRSGTRLEAALRGPMAEHIDTEERHHIVAWLKSGAAEKGYETVVRPILAQRCLACHGPKSGMGLPDLSTYAGVHKVANVDTGVSVHSLVRVSHIHLFGIGLVLFSVGMIFRRVMMRAWLKSTLILLPFAAVFVDILSWFLTKWDPHYAYTVVTAGAVLGLALAAQILTALYQMWFSRPQV